MKLSDDYLAEGASKAGLIRALQEHSGTSNRKLAESIGVSVNTFDVKMSRDSFSWKQMLTLIKACNCKIYIDTTTNC